MRSFNFEIARGQTVTIEVDETTVKPRRIMTAYLERQAQRLPLMADSEPNRATLLELATDTIASEKHHAILDRAVKEGLILAGRRNKRTAKCAITGATIEPEDGYLGKDAAGQWISFSWKALMARFAKMA